MAFQHIFHSLKAHSAKAWRTLFCEKNRTRAQALRQEAHRAFTEHPKEAGETYFEHLCFTTQMSLRFFYSMVVLMIHGVFPFLLTRAASSEIARIYRIMGSRIPKAEREIIDSDYQV